jgi:hypothetical protein
VILFLSTATEEIVGHIRAPDRDGVVEIEDSALVLEKEDRTVSICSKAD